jgi:gamma-glutamyltranspeptidase/glutathione hydrolase
MDQLWFDELPTNRAHFLPNGNLPGIGERFAQPALGRTLQRLVQAEAGAQSHGREAGIAAARARFYTGDIADHIARFYDGAGGLLTREDLADFAVAVEPAVHTTYRGYEVYACGPWCQGPVVPETLNILEGFNDLAALGHNSASALHRIVESLKLAFSDRHHYFGDPRFVSVPIDRLLSKDYAAARRALIDLSRAWPEMPPPGPPVAVRDAAVAVHAEHEPDTSYVCVVDADGNAFSATPSDAPSTPIIPELGCIISSRGYQAWLEPEHPSSVAPGKRPRLTPSPGLVLRDGMVMPYGTPSNDRQPQAMIQFLVNLIDFGFDLQAAVEAPRVASYSFPATGFPHAYDPGLLRVEDSLATDVRAELERLGHRVEVYADTSFEGFGSVSAVICDRDKGVVQGAADPRRVAYAAGW